MKNGIIRGNNCETVGEAGQGCHAVGRCRDYEAVGLLCLLIYKKFNIFNILTCEIHRQYIKSGRTIVFVHLLFDFMIDF